jgi:predicted pyridoxine 5'-phosphate oxidase superfamily flavin-nucleotide-binding protein
MVRIENENYLTKAQRNFLDINKKISLSLRNNNED